MENCGVPAGDIRSGLGTRGALGICHLCGARRGPCEVGGSKEPQNPSGNGETSTVGSGLGDPSGWGQSQDQESLRNEGSRWGLRGSRGEWGPKVGTPPKSRGSRWGPGGRGESGDPGNVGSQISPGVERGSLGMWGPKRVQRWRQSQGLGATEMGGPWGWGIPTAFRDGDNPKGWGVPGDGRSQKGSGMESQGLGDPWACGIPTGFRDGVPRAGVPGGISGMGVPRMAMSQWSAGMGTAAGSGCPSGMGCPGAPALTQKSRLKKKSTYLATGLTKEKSSPRGPAGTATRLAMAERGRAGPNETERSRAGSVLASPRSEHRRAQPRPLPVPPSHWLNSPHSAFLLVSLHVTQTVDAAPWAAGHLSVP